MSLAQNTVGSEALSLPPLFTGWFRQRGWQPHAHQLAVLEAVQAGHDVLLTAPTGGGKTLSGFLPSLIELAERPREGLHTLYISPLKALAVDIHRNLETPIAEMRLSIRHETRTGDTPHAKRERQRRRPPNLLMTTPESLALLLSYNDAGRLFRSLRTIVIDEIHSVVGTKRGDLLSLGLARLRRLAPHSRRIGLSATAAHPDALAEWLGGFDAAPVHRVIGKPGPAPRVEILQPAARTPWSGHMGMHALPEIYDRIRRAGTTIVFVNTRAQAELVFQALWRMNEDDLPIALHHGSLAVEQRRKVEAAMAAGKLRAVVATSSLDLGIDWGAVDLVMQIGAPKGVSRLLQRIGRANHRFDQASDAVLVPANRFEVLECRAAIDGVREMTLDGDPPPPGGLDVLAQHVLGMACSAPFDADDLFEEVCTAAPYARLARSDFDAVLDFVATGGYALGSYDRFKCLKRDDAGRWKVSGPQVTRLYRMNVGTIVEMMTLKVQLGRGRMLGEVEEYFVNALTPGDTFIFAGRLLRFERMRENIVVVSLGDGGEPKVPAYAGGKLPLTTHLADRVRAMLAEPKNWRNLPPPVTEWLSLQRWRSVLPQKGGLLVETFPRGNKVYLVAYCFEGRNAHQTLGMLLTKRMERMGLHPLGFVATDYVLGIWGLERATDMDALFDEDLLGDDLEEWMDESSMLRRAFRKVATIAGVIEQRHPGLEKSGRQMVFSADLIYDVLRRHEPDHILLRATRRDAARELIDIGRIGAMLRRVKGKIVHKSLDQVSPLAVPVLLEIGREQVKGGAIDALLAEAEEDLLEEAMPELSADAAAAKDSQSRLPL
ncbi:MAG: ligase-associated DNA damage response DEXH box helicase [Pseudomonadota bacterium]